MTAIRADSVLVGESEPIRRLRRTIARVAPARLPILVEGPTGTGKELVASLLHQLSGRRGALVAFNVCAVGEAMFDDALFGHLRGAFTGAMTDAPGFLREAHGGTVFFDEISGLPLALQAKLLRAIETGVFRPIGAARDTTSDFRVIAATNEAIEPLVAAGRFRADLAHRMSGIILTVPSLSERVDDIPLLVSHFAAGRRVSAEAIALLQERHWPGNVRELKQAVDAAVVFSGDVLDADAVRSALAHRARPTVPAVAGSGDDVYIAAERARVVQLLDSASWDTERVASDLGVHRSTLYRRLKRLGVALPPSMCVREAPVAEGEECYPFAQIRANSRDK